MTDPKMSPYQQQRIRQQLVGVRLIAAEIADEVETVRHHVNRAADRDDTLHGDAIKSLARIDALLEQLRKN